MRETAGELSDRTVVAVASTIPCALSGSIVHG
jgi:hypothetical protein